ncbi:unnamed protein product, partial [Ectocarpus sp. 13 AM-2016]
PRSLCVSLPLSPCLAPCVWCLRCEPTSHRPLPLATKKQPRPTTKSVFLLSLPLRIANSSSKGHTLLPSRSRLNSRCGVFLAAPLTVSGPGRCISREHVWFQTSLLLGLGSA